MNATSMTILTVSIAAGSAIAGFEAPNAHTWPMEHVMISMTNNQIDAHTNDGAMVDLLRFAGESYSGDASVLDDSYYSDQYGWVADGFIDLSAGEFMWISFVSGTDGLDVYEGGRRTMSDTHTYDAIQGTDGSDNAWMWSGVMTHNWYSVQEAGLYEATYEVYVGDADGNALTAYTSDTVTLNFNAVPAPSSLALLGMGGVVATRRRRA